jgi:hypothetical protein
MKLKKWIQVLIITTLLGATASAQEYIEPRRSFGPPELCTGARVLTREGYSGTVEALYQDREDAEVRLYRASGRSWTERMRVRDLALTNICVNRGSICVGQSVFADGYEAIVVGLFLDGEYALVDYLNNRMPDLVAVRNLALRDVCIVPGRCPHGRPRILPK